MGRFHFRALDDHLMPLDALACMTEYARARPHPVPASSVALPLPALVAAQVGRQSREKIESSGWAGQQALDKCPAYGSLCAAAALR